MTAPTPTAGRVIVVFNRFPTRSETFLFREFVAWRRDGLDVRAFSLLRPEGDLPQEMRSWSADVLYLGDALRGAIGGGLLAGLSAAARVAWRRSGRLLVAIAGRLAGVVLSEAAVRIGAGRLHAAWGNAPAEAALVASRRAGVPFSVSLHAADYWRDTTASAERLTAADWLLVCNRQLRADLLAANAALEPRVRLVPHSIDAARFALAERRPGPPWRLLCVARLVPKKGLSTLIEACRLLQASELDFMCTVVGAGPLLKDLSRQIRKHGLSARVKLTGPLDQEGVAAAMADSHFLLLTSQVAADGDREGLPNVVLEALLTGLPVIATRTGSLAEVLSHGETGLLVEPHDAQGVAGAVLDLAANYQHGTALGRAGRARVLERTALGNQAEALARLFAHGMDPVEGTSLGR